ncbi:aromatic-ring-hydroxylating dioxygenase subunit beta [Pusillimonas sp. T2]|uniref:aromatic-ring-hydroxylating dioxygenase subunit beta n=1 Tax=Pusillimonas sp. T2 TaxID=1548123 RepID=UPI000B9D28E0|nr:aromatic-ring-hydroxylating dioxygenase subunit beta [Pusillimonas sp. T2]OXR50213.1 aromatic-ring-hydroxylating dioxygenase subunit beta [Pusillimonas sp. T2]
MTHPSNTVGASIDYSTIQQFLYREARLLDQLLYDDWLSLFADGGTYWIPAVRGQTDPLNVPSIIYENTDLLKMRVRRLADERTYQSAPRPYTTHIVGNILVEDPGQHDLVVHSSLMVHEFRDEQRRLFSGLCTHVLRNTPEGMKIASKRIELTDCDGLHTAFMSLL